MSDETVLPFPGASGVPPKLVAAVEALLFAAGAPLRLDALASLLPDAHPDDIRAALGVLGARCGQEDRGIVLTEVAGGWQLRTDARFASEVAQLLRAKPVKLSRAAQEVLAIVAYEQPVTKQDVDHVRGVDSGATVKNLLQRGLIRVSGRREIPGRPLEYRTTRAFLQLLSLSELSDLPTLEEASQLDE
ncbi:MAG: SMC-Scp complex subunit ScpB [Myxococcota bacterium]